MLFSYSLPTSRVLFPENEVVLKNGFRIFFEILMKSWVVFSLFSTIGDYVKTV
jgi:hypothetical protein